ncbi:hypothetical protein [Nocardiopsis nanhaiensis]
MAKVRRARAKRTRPVNERLLRPIAYKDRLKQVHAYLTANGDDSQLSQAHLVNAMISHAPDIWPHDRDVQAERAADREILAYYRQLAS